jgi:hypothetical protein
MNLYKFFGFIVIFCGIILVSHSIGASIGHYPGKATFNEVFAGLIMLAAGILIVFAKPPKPQKTDNPIMAILMALHIPPVRDSGLYYCPTCKGFITPKAKIIEGSHRMVDYFCPHCGFQDYEASRCDVCNGDTFPQLLVKLDDYHVCHKCLEKARTKENPK